jgi:hypothetical protein
VGRVEMIGCGDVAISHGRCNGLSILSHEEDVNGEAWRVLTLSTGR